MLNIYGVTNVQEYRHICGFLEINNLHITSKRILKAFGVINEISDSYVTFRNLTIYVYVSVYSEDDDISVLKPLIYSPIILTLFSNLLYDHLEILYDHVYITKLLLKSTLN